MGQAHSSGKDITPQLSFLEDGLHTGKDGTKYLKIDSKIFQYTDRSSLKGRNSSTHEVKDVVTSQAFIAKQINTRKFPKEESILNDLNTGILVCTYPGTAERRTFVLKKLGQIKLDQHRFADEKQKIHAFLQLLAFVMKLNTGEMSKQNNKILHNDIHPGNCVIDTESNVLSLVDYGHAGPLAQKGATDYQAPELRKDNDEISYPWSARTSTPTETFMLGLVLLSTKPTSRIDQDIAKLMSSLEPDGRPEKEIVFYALLLRFIQDDDSIDAGIAPLELPKSITDCFNDITRGNASYSKIELCKAMQIILSCSTVAHNLATRENLPKIKKNSTLVRVLAEVFDYMHATESTWWKHRHGREDACKLIRSMMNISQREDDVLIKKTKQWCIKDHSSLFSSGGETERSKLLNRSSLLSGPVARGPTG